MDEAARGINGVELDEPAGDLADKKNGVARLEFSSIEDREAQAGGIADAVAELKAQAAALETKLAEQKQAAAKQIEEARLLARLLARKECEEEMEHRAQEGRVQVRRTCEEFERERTRYFAAVEAQVVKLALAIAGRVLHREAKMDPLLLSAAVRVALEKVKDDSETRLRVPMAEGEGWKAAFHIEPDGDAKNAAGGVQVVGDGEMARGECVIETSVGTVELGIEAQLLEIEQGFFDLLRKRPA
jgi:flagellar assembly protein FliH